MSNLFPIEERYKEESFKVIGLDAVSKFRICKELLLCILTSLCHNQRNESVFYHWKCIELHQRLSFQEGQNK